MIGKHAPDWAAMAAALLRSSARSRAPAAPKRGRRLPSLTAALLATLLTSTIALTMERSTEDIVTLALHYPLFFVIALSVLAPVPSSWRAVLSLAALPLLGIEIAAMRLL